jgi:hypothetical protein
MSMWSQPPGGLTQEQRRHRRRRQKASVAAVVVLFGGCTSLSAITVGRDGASQTQVLDLEFRGHTGDPR